MIDLHAHILPGLDDGPKHLDEALEMCRIAVRDGVTTIVATPHAGNGTYDNKKEKILSAVQQLVAHLEESKIPLRILAGSDAYIRQDLCTLVEDGSITTVNDSHRYVMVEFPKHVITPQWMDWLFEARLRGIIPIFTHPERHTVIQKDISMVSRWVNQGGLVQVTAMSLTGDFGPDARKCAEELLRRHLAHVIASDAHSRHQRPPVLSKAFFAASNVVDSSYAYKLVKEFPEAIIAGENIIDVPEPVFNKRGLFRRICSTFTS